MKRLLKDIKELLYPEIIKRKEVNPFIVFSCFIASFAIARLVALFFPEVSLIVNDYHIHHFYYGIGLLIISNWILLVSNSTLISKIAAALFGTGLGLITDEIGLLLTCNSSGKICDYYSRQSYDLAIIITLVFFIIIYFPPVWHHIKQRMKR